MTLTRGPSDAVRRRRDQLAALYAQRQYEAAARANRGRAADFRVIGDNDMADQLDAAADIAAKAARREIFLGGAP